MEELDPVAADNAEQEARELALRTSDPVPATEPAPVVQIKGLFSVIVRAILAAYVLIVLLTLLLAYVLDNA